MNDPNVEEVRRVRDELVKKYGGLDGWIKHLQLRELDRTRKPKTRVTKAAASVRVRKKANRNPPHGRVSDSRS